MSLFRFFSRYMMPALTVLAIATIIAAPSARDTTPLWTGAQLAALAFLSVGGSIWLLLAAALHCFTKKERPRHARY